MEASDPDQYPGVSRGEGGYVGRDGQVPPGEEQRVRAIHDLSSQGQ